MGEEELVGHLNHRPKQQASNQSKHLYLEASAALGQRQHQAEREANQGRNQVEKYAQERQSYPRAASSGVPRASSNCSRAIPASLLRIFPKRNEEATNRRRSTAPAHGQQIC